MEKLLVRITAKAEGRMKGKSAEANQIKLEKRDGGFFLERYV